MGLPGVAVGMVHSRKKTEESYQRFDPERRNEMEFGVHRIEPTINLLMQPFSFVCCCAAALQITIACPNAGDNKMKTRSTNPVMANESPEGNNRSNWLRFLSNFSVLVCVVIVTVSGCTTTPTALSEQDLTPYASVKLTEGDTLAITFPGSPTLNTTQRIRRDGKIDLQSVGELTVVGKTPAELEKEVLKLFESQLVLKEVSVTLLSSELRVFVTGSVVHPGKILADRPISALEAIMEAGGFDYTKANQKAVAVIRHEGSTTQRYKLNLKNELSGRDVEPFALKSFDIIYVPEKFAWF